MLFIFKITSNIAMPKMCAYTHYYAYMNAPHAILSCSKVDHVCVCVCIMTHTCMLSLCPRVGIRLSFIHVHVHTYTCIHTCTHSYTYTLTYIYTSLHTYMFRRSCAWIQVFLGMYVFDVQYHLCCSRLLQWRPHGAHIQCYVHIYACMYNTLHAAAYCQRPPLQVII